jgi:hypothetical protein
VPKPLLTSLDRHDLFLTSRRLAAPALPNPWTNEDLLREILSVGGADAGSGFVESVPGGLPQDAIATFRYLSATDWALSLGARSEKQRCLLISAVSDAQHRLMCLPPWLELPIEDRLVSHPATYECCRLSATLYSMCVIFPVPVASGWHIDLLERLCVLHTTSGLLHWPDASYLAIWSLFVAAIAAYETTHSNFFINVLDEALSIAGVTRWQEARRIVRKFMWTDSACEAAALLIAEQLKLKKTESM